ncbi:hypothetical protein CBR_g36470 [Chara braunii]|uniref:Uncharacterized protein n=1 Tax=Chara braunii TaxID=69332 RepID=A0A388LL33_CHABU|nr:hypothetical protein CBR_g36470 [Chara braunii]|eukprot:GBG82943.1 hypothetical protein CBR_g36470 [Chara braunii]
MQKDMQLQLAIHVGELEDRLVQRLNQVVSVVPPSQERGKKNVTYNQNEVPSASSRDESDTNVTQDLSACAGRLEISDKRKRGPKPVFEDPSPLMEQPAKRTLIREILKPIKLTGRLTRSKSKKAGGSLTPTSAKKKIATPLSKRCTPTRKRTPLVSATVDTSLERLRYLDNVLRELKDLNAMELQRICREENIPYDKKIDGIFDIVDYRTERAFIAATAEAEYITISDDVSTQPKEIATTVG